MKQRHSLLLLRIKQRQRRQKASRANAGRSEFFRVAKHCELGFGLGSSRTFKLMSVRFAHSIHGNKIIFLLLKVRCIL